MGFVYLNPFISAIFSEMDYVEEHAVKLLCKSHFCFLISATSCEYPLRWEPQEIREMPEVPYLGVNLERNKKKKNHQRALFGKESVAFKK